MTQTLLIDRPLVVKNVDDIRQMLMAGLEDADRLDIQFSPDLAADLCGVQLIEAARLHAASAGKGLTLKAPAEGLRPLLESAGFLNEETGESGRFWLHEEACA